MGLSPMPVIVGVRVHRFIVNRPQHRDYPSLFEKCVGSFKFPDRISTTFKTSLSTDGVAKEGHTTFNPREDTSW